jgi:hypothetical protein
MQPCPSWTPNLGSTAPTPPHAVTSPPAPRLPPWSIPQAIPALDLACTTPRPCHSDATMLPSTSRAGDAFPCTYTPPSLAPHAHLHGIEPATWCHHCPAPPSTHATGPSLKLTVARLKPPPLRPNRLATNANHHTPRLTTRCCPREPPMKPNCVQHWCTWDRAYSYS